MELAAEAGDEAPVPPPPLPPARVKQRRGPRLPRITRTLTADEEQRLAEAGGILGE